MPRKLGDEPGQGVAANLELINGDMKSATAGVNMSKRTAAISTWALMLVCLSAVSAQDYATLKVLEDYRRKASKGDIEKQVSLGVWLYHGLNNVPANEREAAKWFQRAADRGHVEAQSYLGKMYVEGRGVPKNYRLAAKWSKLAALQGSRYGQYELAVLYNNGWGVSKDHAEAAKWFQRAAWQRHKNAQFFLGAYYLIGKGVPQDFTKAYAWLGQAAAQGHKEAAKKQRLIEKVLTAEQLGVAQDAASELYNRIDASKGK